MGIKVCISTFFLPFLPRLLNRLLVCQSGIERSYQALRTIVPPGARRSPRFQLLVGIVEPWLSSCVSLVPSGYAAAYTAGRYR